MKKLLLLTTIIFCHNSFAQEMWGISNSNFAGSSGMNLNPASMMLMPYKWEVTLVTADISIQNNYVGFLRSNISNPPENGATQKNGGLVPNYSIRHIKAGTHVMLKVPSFIYRTRKLAFGFHAAVRSDFSIRHIPASLANIAFEGTQLPTLYGSTFNPSGLRLGSLTWAETGISAGKVLKKSSEKKLLAAATLKYISAFEGAYFKLDNAALNVGVDSSITLTGLSGQLDFAIPRDPSQGFSLQGHGAGFDIGLCYVSQPYPDGTVKQKAGPVRKYVYRIGASLMDAGIVAFTNNASGYKFSNQSVVMNKPGSTKANGIEGLDSLLSATLMNGKSASRHFIMALPTALSIQYDRCLAERWYANASVVQRARLPMAQVDRANNISVSLRYETKFFEVAIPYSLYEYYDHRIGAAMRYHFLFIGTDKLGTFIGSQNITGLDFYFGIKLNNFDFMKKGKRGKANSCATF